jgi:sugar lactone lactonase YvrE
MQMEWKRLLGRLTCVAVVSVAMPLWGSSSYYPLRLEDSKAVSLVRGEAGLHGDGIADDTDAIQKAIDKVQETTGQGIVFVPEGRYRLSKTVFVWPGIRLIGYGAKRPTFVLGKNTPGYQDGLGYMVMFTGNRPPANGALPRRQGRVSPPIPGIVPSNPRIADANPGTFYSAMSNIDFEIEDGNPAAVGIRLHFAQHCYLAHMDFHIGSGLSALHDVGNEAEDLHFYGGQYGIMTRKPSPGWQFTLLDSTFEGQSKAAIKEHEAGLTLIRAQIRHTPTAISIDPDYSEELWVKDSRFEDISGPAVIVSNEHGLRTEINLEDIVCRNVPIFAAFRESGNRLPGRGEMYRVNEMTHGLTFASPSAKGEVKTHFDVSSLGSMPDPVASDIPALPARSTWVNLRTLGAKGDGTTDDTAAIRQAIASHRTIYIPSGRYIVSDTITLRPDTVLIGLNPSTTQFDIPDSTPAFQGPGSPKPLLEAPKGGTNIVTGIGLYTNGINSRAVGAKWMAGKDSLMDDVRFLGGHGTFVPGMTPIYNNTHTADTDLNRRWDSQYPSLWVTDGGGGTFANIWTPSTFAQAGMLISNTATEGRVYELSSEHHVRNEVKLSHVSNWKIYALQTEEERGEGPFCLPLSIEDSSNITVANYHSYRVVSSYQPFVNAIHVADSHNIRLRNVHVYGDNKVSFDNSVIVDGGTPQMVRNREFAAMTIDTSERDRETQEQKPSPVLADGAKVERLTGGFYNISGAAVDPAGQLYFVDAHWQRIYRWLPEEKRAAIVRDSPLDPVQLVFDKAGDLMVVSYDGNGTVYSFRPDALDEEITLIKPQKAESRDGKTPVIPVNYWRNENDFVKAVPVAKPYQYVSPDGTTFIPAGEDFVTGALYYGTKMADVLRAFGLGKAVEGKPFYVSDEGMQKTYSAEVGPDGTLTSPKLFAENGGESLAQDAAGNVYIAAGQIYVYSPAGELIDTIKVPERPIDLVFGGKDGRTLYILARTSLYSVQVR